MRWVVFRRPGKRGLAAGIATLALAGFMAHAAWGATTIEKQRSEFLKAYAAAQMGKSTWRRWSEDLKGYPLYPYLQAAELEHNLSRTKSGDIARYLKHYHGLIPAERLRGRYLHLLARRHQWRHYLAFYRPGFGTTLQCYSLRARLALGQKLDFSRDLADLWPKPSLPRACNKVQVWAHKHGLLTPKRLWLRIDSAADARRSSTIRWLARWLPRNQAVVARRYAEALRRPLHTVRAARKWPDTGRNREAALLAITELARHSSRRAEREWPRLKRHFKFSAHARGRILRSLALYRAYGFHEDALKRLAALPKPATTDATRAWRVRVAVANEDWHGALAALDALSSDQSHENSWRYLRARVLQQLGQGKKARELLETVSGESNYWGFLAADKLGKPYVICPQSVQYDSQGETELLARPTYARAFELFALGMLRKARREWARAIKDSDSRVQNQAAALAFRRGWYSRAIFTYSYGDLLHHYRERFPLAEHNAVSVAHRKTGVDSAWIYATIRAESAWIPDAGSGAGARGLMQLMPATARHVARSHGVSAKGYNYDSDVSIRLGSYYLERMAKRYDGRLWLASIAYNAGPGRASRWLAERDALPPDLFIMTIPFTETRNYVISILAYSVIYDWRLHGKPTSVTWRLKSGVDVEDKRIRKKVICPPPTTAKQGASAATH